MASNIDAVKKYQEKRDAILLRPSKEDGARYRATAKQAGMSLQAYVFLAIEEYMKNLAQYEKANEIKEVFGKEKVKHRAEKDMER